MSLRCRAGDLAILTEDIEVPALWGSIVAVRSGAVVKVVELLDTRCWRIEDPIAFAADIHPFRVIGEVQGIDDSILRPLRDEPGLDQTLEWAPAPAVLEAL